MCHLIVCTCSTCFPLSEVSIIGYEVVSSSCSYVRPKSVDQGEAQPREDGQVELIFNLTRIIENLTWTICGGMLEEWAAPGAINGEVLMASLVIREFGRP